MSLPGFLDRVCRAIEIVAGIMLAAITTLIFISVIGRYLFTYPIPDNFDLSRMLMGATIFWGYAAIGYNGDHISVDIFTRTLPRRVQWFLEIAIAFILAAFTVILCYKLFSRVSSAFASGETTFDLRLPMWPFVLLIWLGLLAAVLTTMFRLISTISGRRSGPDATSSGQFE